MSDYRLYHNNPNIETLKEYVDSYKIRLDKSFTLKDFFNKNKEIIFNQLDTLQLLELGKKKNKSIEDLTSADIDENIVLPCPCYFFIDDKYVNYSIAVKNTNFQIQETDFIAFADKQIKNIISENSVYLDKKQKDIERFKPGCRIIGWFKSLYYSGKEGNGNINNIYDSTSNFIDITPFVTNINTSVSNSGGSFSFTLPHIPLYYDNYFVLDTDYVNVKKFFDSEQLKNSYINEKELQVKTEFSSLDYFEWLIQHNDLLFISFNDMEELTDDNLSGCVFDMIGLVDTVSVNRNPSSANISITVSGRDLLKLITDDSSIYFPTGVAASNGRIFDNTETTNKGGDLESIMRFKGVDNQDGTPRQLTNMLNIFAEEPNDFSIDFILKVVVSHLSNLQIVPDNLFSSWRDKRTKFSSYNSNEQGLAKGIWQIIKLLVDGNVADLRLHDAAMSIQTGSLMTFFNKVCQQPFVEFMGDTFGDQYYLIARKPPFDKEGMFKTLSSQGIELGTFGESIYDIDNTDIINVNLSFNNQNIYSWYQFYPIYEMGASEDLKYIIPAVLFPEYAAIYGSRDLVIQSQYRSFNKAWIKDELNKNNKSQIGDAEVRHSIHDLKYIIESNAYSPFTRTGTIQIVGNRKIKKGMFIRLNWGNFCEIFYVDSVNNDYSVTTSGVNRTTTLSVSRGMLENLIFLEGGSNPNYFNIIDFGEYEKNKDKITMDSWIDIISSWKVNINTFKFFLRKMQFLRSNEISIIGKKEEKNK